jgi:hypothetical protein
VVVCEVSAFRFGLPPTIWVRKLVGCTDGSNTVAGTPVATHSALTAAVCCAAGWRLEHGSVAVGPLVPATEQLADVGRADRFRFCARKVRLSTGVHSVPTELVHTVPTDSTS